MTNSNVVDWMGSRNTKKTLERPCEALGILTAKEKVRNELLTGAVSSLAERQKSDLIEPIFKECKGRVRYSNLFMAIKGRA